MYFKARFELGAYGSEFSKSFVLVKLMDKNQVMQFSKTLAKTSKSLEGEEDIDKTLSGSEEVMDKMYKACADAFISGEIYDSETEEQRPMKKEDIEFFPPAVIRDMVQFVQGSLGKKA